MTPLNVSIFSTSVAATAAIAANTFVTGAGATAAAAGNALGVSRFDGDIGDQVTVDVLGSAVVIAGGVIADGALVEVGANGDAVAHAAGVPVARVLGAGAAGAGQLVEVLLIPN